uniref:Calmodulin-lysine N-methyltransferase n=1 Tax=Nicotiana tabacum TaxID=4097 RepID=A0A1S3Y804_TOBAC|nr:PREDICTED: calmodulin-lysine N-methyltransferase-like [Nicotiana tabacum]
MCKEIEANSANSTTSASSLRWKILSRSLHSDNESELGIKRISRKENQLDGSRDATLCYTLPVPNAPTLILHQRVDSMAHLNDFEVCNRYDIDNTGLVCQWPSEDVLAHYCLSHESIFRQKRVIELGSGYGLAGLVVAMTMEALEVFISDGNPQVVDYLEHMYAAVDSLGYGSTEVKPLMLHWGQDQVSDISNRFNIIIASDCTFFKEFHAALVRTIKSLLKKEGPSEAILFCPNRGDSLDKFLLEVKNSGLHFQADEILDAEVWRRHQHFVDGDDSWPNYEMDHCYPLLIRIMR